MPCFKWKPSCRWSDNDQYGHVNNSIFYLYIDTIVNTYLIRHCSLNPSPGIASTEPIGLVVESNAQFHSSVSFPGVIEAGLAITKLGNSSVRYQVGIFEEGQSQAAVTGGFTHVFVDREGRRPLKIPEAMRGGMDKLFVRVDKPEGKEWIWLEREPDVRIGDAIFSIGRIQNTNCDNNSHSWRQALTVTRENSLSDINKHALSVLPCSDSRLTRMASSSRKPPEDFIDIDDSQVDVHGSEDPPQKGYDWEQEYKRSWDVLQEDSEGRLESAVAQLQQQAKRRR